MKAWPRWFVWQLSDWDGKKYQTKNPVRGGDRHRFALPEAHTAGDLLAYDMACQYLAECRTADPQRRYALGWYVMPDAGYWFLDLDGVLTWPQGLGVGQPMLDPVAQQALAALPGVFLEYSSSMSGLHFVGRGALLENHKVKGQGMPHGVELYSANRGMCFGLTGEAWGNADTIANPPWQVARGAVADGIVVGQRMPEWDGPEDDDALIALMTRPRSGDAVKALVGGVSLSQLWAGEGADKMGASEADGALASHLAWWTGCDMPRMQRLMWRSGLVRDKWSSDAHRTYVEITCRTACEKLLSREQPSCYVKRPELPPLPAAPQALPAVAVAPSGSVDEFRGMAWAMELISRAGNSDELKQGCEQIKAMQQWDAQDSETLAQRLKRKSKELLCDWSLAICRGMVREVQPVVGALGSPDWLADWVYVATQDKYCNVTRGYSLYGRTALHTVLCNRPEVPRKPNGDRMKVPDLFDEWQVQIADDMGYKPGGDLVFEQDGQLLVNQFIGSMPYPSPAPGPAWAIEVVERHMRNICNHDDAQYSLVLRWMANIVQNPGRIARWGLMIIGNQGTGKSMFSKPLERAIGGLANVKFASAKNINNKGGFMDWAARGKLLGVLSDFSITGPERFETAEATKPVVSDDIVSITRKGESDVTYYNYASYIASTNVREPMPISPNERRWLFISTDFLNHMVAGDPAAAAEYFTQLSDAIDALTPEQWSAWFHSIDVGDMPMRAPVTSVQLAICSNSVSEARQIVEELVSGWNVVTSNRITEILRGVDNAPSKRALTRLMNDLGFDYADKRMTITDTGNKVGVYVKSVHAGASWEWLCQEAKAFNSHQQAKVMHPLLTHNQAVQGVGSTNDPLLTHAGGAVGMPKLPQIGGIPQI